MHCTRSAVHSSSHSETNKLVESLQIWNPINTNTMAAQQVVETLSAINLQFIQLYFLILYVVSVLSCLHSDVGMQVMIIFIFYIDIFRYIKYSLSRFVKFMLVCRKICTFFYVHSK